MLDVKNIDVYYGDLQALWDVSLTVEAGEILVVVGPNGAGKSTLLKTIAGALYPIKGSIIFDAQHAERVDKLPANKRVGLGICLVPEGRSLFSTMTVMENLELGAYLSNARKAKVQTLKQVFDIFPILKERQSQRSGTLSGGEQQMLAIGRGLMSKPKLLLLDEPSQGLAPILIKNIFEVIGEIKHLGVTILLVEQNVKQSLELANRAYILENGRIVGHGDSKTLINNQHIREAYLGT